MLVRRLPSRALLAGLVLCLSFFVGSSARAAATYTVNTTADNPPSPSDCSGAPGDCSLRQALGKAVSGDTVVVPANSSPYVVSGTFIPVAGGVTITGAGASGTVVSGGGTTQIFDLTGGGPVSISRLTLTDAANTTGSDNAGAINTEDTTSDLTLDGMVIKNSSSNGGFGGAIEIGSTVVIKHSRFTNDSATGSGDGGGAIDFYGSSHTMTISDSVFEGNSSPGSPGGAILVENSNTLNVRSTTFLGNSAAGHAGGAVNFLTGATAGTFTNTTFSGNNAGNGGALAGGTLTLLNDTFSGNTAATGANIDEPSGTAAAENTIFASPLGGGANCSGTVTSNGHNLEDTTPSTCGLSAASGDIIGRNPALSTLADNSSQVPTPGGPPQTMALGASSPALGAGDAVGCTSAGSVDERGFPRPGNPGSGCDIGAYENLAQVSTAITLTNTTAHPVAGSPVTLKAVVAAGRTLPSAVPGPTGSINFLKDGLPMSGQAFLDASSTGTINTPPLSAGVHHFTATYSGDPLYAGSASAQLAVTVPPLRPVITRLRESHKVWREGGKLARLTAAHRAPLGTTFSFVLNATGNVQLKFTRLVRSRHHTRKLKAGTLTFRHGHVGTNKIRFQGRLSRHRRLKLGRYKVTLTVRNATGHTSKTLSFRIVRR